MPITLAEASVGRADKVTQEVIDTLRRGSQFMDELTFDDAVSPGVGGSTLTYGYLQLQTPSTAAGREINSEYTANEAKKVKKTVDLKIFGGAAEVDRVIQEATTDEIAFQLEQKTKATKNFFQYTCINGSKTDKSVDFDGLTTLLKGTSTEYNAGSDKTVVDLSTSALVTSNYQLMIDMLNEFIGGIDGKPTFCLATARLSPNSKVWLSVQDTSQEQRTLLVRLLRVTIILFFTIWVTITTALPLFLAYQSMKQVHQAQR